jgi:hypothetical protein
MYGQNSRTSAAHRAQRPAQTGHWMIHPVALFSLWLGGFYLVRPDRRWGRATELVIAFGIVSTDVVRI